MVNDIPYIHHTADDTVDDEDLPDRVSPYQYYPEEYPGQLHSQLPLHQEDPDGSILTTPDSLDRLISDTLFQTATRRPPGLTASLEPLYSRQPSPLLPDLFNEVTDNMDTQMLDILLPAYDMYSDPLLFHHPPPLSTDTPESALTTLFSTDSTVTTPEEQFDIDLAHHLVKSSPVEHESEDDQKHKRKRRKRTDISIKRARAKKKKMNSAMQDATLRRRIPVDLPSKRRAADNLAKRKLSVDVATIRKLADVKQSEPKPDPDTRPLDTQAADTRAGTNWTTVAVAAGTFAIGFGVARLF